MAQDQPQLLWAFGEWRRGQNIYLSTYFFANQPKIKKKKKKNNNTKKQGQKLEMWRAYTQCSEM